MNSMNIAENTETFYYMNSFKNTISNKMNTDEEIEFQIKEVKVKQHSRRK